MKPAQLKFIQAFADLLIPLLGYFWWNWNFYFILLFILLDFLVFCVFTFVKIKKIADYQGFQSTFPWKQVLLSTILIFAGLAIVYPALILVNPDFNAAKETWDFLAYKDLGVAQGIVLLPLLIYGGYMQYKMQFLINGKFTVAQPSAVWRTHYMTILLVLTVSALFLGISTFVVFPQIVYVLTLIFGVAMYRFFFSRV